MIRKPVSINALEAFFSEAALVERLSISCGSCIPV
jgi:hypothetical protein